MRIDKECSKLMDSKCDKDYKNQHFWERRGIAMINHELCLIWQCSQCELCIIERLKYLIRVVEE